MKARALRNNEIAIRVVLSEWLPFEVIDTYRNKRESRGRESTKKTQTHEWDTHFKGQEMWLRNFYWYYGMKWIYWIDHEIHLQEKQQYIC